MDKLFMVMASLPLWSDVKINQYKYISDQAEDIISFKGLFAQDPTEVIIAKKTCGALKAGVRSRYNILGARRWLGAPLIRK